MSKEDRLERKYTWASADFDKWVKDQAVRVRQKGGEISTASITHKLLNDFIIPNNIRIEPPKLEGRLKLRKKQIY